MKNSRLYFPAATTLRGTFPRSSMIRAMWSAHHHIRHRGNKHGSALRHAHTSTRTYTGWMVPTHTDALGYTADALRDRLVMQWEACSRCFNHTFKSDFTMVCQCIISVPLRHPCVPVPPALWPALPLLLKNSREYFPESAKCLGIQPSSSMMWAMWSMEERGRSEEGEGREKKKKKRKGAGNVDKEIEI